MKNLLVLFLACLAVMLLESCAGERQGLVCEEIEYRLNTQTYSPDQRAYIEEELRVCREEEADKKAAGTAQRQSIYDRFAASDTTQKKTHVQETSGNFQEQPSGDPSQDISVSEALKDSSGVQTQSIYDRYSNKNGEADVQ